MSEDLGLLQGHHFLICYMEQFHLPQNFVREQMWQMRRSFCHVKMATLFFPGASGSSMAEGRLQVSKAFVFSDVFLHLFWLALLSKVISTTFIKHQAWGFSQATHTHTNTHTPCTSIGWPPAFWNMYSVSLKGTWQESSGLCDHGICSCWTFPGPEGMPASGNATGLPLFTWPFLTPCLWALESSCRRLIDLPRQLPRTGCQWFFSTGAFQEMDTFPGPKVKKLETERDMESCCAENKPPLSPWAVE